MRIVKHAIGVFCLLAALLLAVVWVRSYWVGDRFRDTWYSNEGELYVYYQEFWSAGRGQLRWYRFGIGRSLVGPIKVNPDQVRAQEPEEPLSYERFVPPPRNTESPWHGFEDETWGSRVSDGYLAQWARGVAIPIWLPLLIFAAPAGLWLLSVLRRRRGAHECPNCGYDLRATPDRCPECGRAAD